jgi:uncharacterized protein (TIGR02996 family)
VNADATRAALEAALLDNPDDLATCMAYADHLHEQGDPRGELIQVQLALEDSARSADERRKLRAREQALLKKHERTWLGPLAPHLLDGWTGDLNPDYYAGTQEVEHRWRRGFLDSLHVAWLTRLLAQHLVDSPAAALLRELRVDGDGGSWGEDEVEFHGPPPRVRRPRGAREHLALFELIGSPCLRALRVFRLGDEESDEGWADCHCYAPGLEHVVAAMPRVEELHLLCKNYNPRKLFGLHNLDHLRVLQAYHLDDYPVAILAKNPALGNLTHLWFHPHFFGSYREGDGYLPYRQLAALVGSPYLKKLVNLRFRLSSAGDRGVRLLIESGFLARLRVLDLRHGCVTDAGARLLADCPATRRLDLLDLGRNQLTAEGVALLQGLGIAVRCDDQHQVGSKRYLEEGDFE